MPATQVSICNLALQLVGAKRIAAIDEGSEQARACELLYEPTRQELLRTHFWRFARARASITASVTDPAWGYDKAFDRPADCLQVWAIDTGGYSTRGVRWTVEGGSIYANTEGPLKILYSKDVTDEAEFDVLFVQLFAHQLAVYLCDPLTQDNTKSQLLSQSLGRIYANATAADAVESLEMIEADGDWITNRMLGGVSGDPTLVFGGYGY